MPYPESCPECGSTFRNTGTHFTARRNEVGRHVLLELGCQNTTRRFWWDFTTGQTTDDGRPSAARRVPLAETVSAGSSTNGALHAVTNGSFRFESNGRGTLSTLEHTRGVAPSASLPEVLASLGSSASRPEPTTQLESSLAVNEAGPGPGTDLSRPPVESAAAMSPAATPEPRAEAERQRTPEAEPARPVEPDPEPQPLAEPQEAAPLGALVGPVTGAASGSLKEAFVRQLQLDRLTLRQMRSWLMSEEARRAIEVAAGATEATYERLALILFGSELPELAGKPAAAPQNSSMTAEDRLELQREKARIRARVRRAAAKAARQTA